MGVHHLQRSLASAEDQRTDAAELSLRLRLPASEREILLSGHRQMLLNAFALMREHRFGLRSEEQQSILTQLFEDRAVPAWSSRAREVELLRRILLATQTTDVRRDVETAIGFSGVELLQEKLQNLLYRAEGSWADELATRCRALSSIGDGQRDLLVRTIEAKGSTILRKLPEIAALLAVSGHDTRSDPERARLCSAAAGFILERSPAHLLHALCRERCVGGSSASRPILWLLMRSCDELPAATIDTLCDKASALPAATIDADARLIPGPIVHPCVVAGLHRRTEAMVASEAMRLKDPPRVVTGALASLLGRLFGTPVELIAESARYGSPYVWRLYHPPVSECVESLS